MGRTAVCLTVVFASIFLGAPHADGRYLMEMSGYDLRPYVRGSWGVGDARSLIDQSSQNWWGSSQAAPLPDATTVFGQQGWNDHPLSSEVYLSFDGSRQLWREYTIDNNLYGYVGAALSEN